MQTVVSILPVILWMLNRGTKGWNMLIQSLFRLHIVVTSNAEKDLQRLRNLDTIGGVMEIEYVFENTNS